MTFCFGEDAGGLTPSPGDHGKSMLPSKTMSHLMQRWMAKTVMHLITSKMLLKTNA